MSDLLMNDNSKATEFVADWEKRTSQQQKKHMWLSVVAFFIAASVCIFMFFWFQNTNFMRIVNQNMNYIQDSAVQEANQVEKELDNAEVLIQNLADQYAILVKFNNGETVEDRLNLLRDENIFDRIAFIAPDGKDISLEGVADVSDRTYFKDAIAGKTGWEMLEKSRVTGKPTVVFYSPVKVENKIVGVMAGFYEQERLDDLFSYQLFNYAPNTYLLNGTGRVIANSKDEIIETNLLDKLSEQTFIGDTDFTKIKEAIEDEERTTISFTFYDEGETTVGVIVQFNNSDWMILSVLPDNVTSSMVNNANRAGQNLLIAVVLVFLVLMLLFIVFFKRQRENLEEEIDTAAENLKITVENEQKQLAIIESLVNSYTSVYYINLENHEYQRIKEEETTVLAIPDSGNADKGFDLYVEKFIDESFKKEVRQFLEVDSFKERLENNGVLAAEFQRVDKRWRRGAVMATETDEKGGVITAVFAVQRIDEEKKKELSTKEALKEAYEAAQIANNAKTIFLSNMSHDIRTPMNAIVGMTAIAAANIENQEKVSDCLKKITSSSKHLLGLINEVLDMSEIESGKVDLYEEEFSISELIDNLITVNQSLISEKNHTLIVKVNNVTHEKVIGDSTRLQQVFINLLSNAIKYTPENGKIEITISEKNTNKTTVGWFEVVFKDNGIGMSEEFQKNLFEPFARAKDDRISEIQGTGLGMPIAKNIINMMNGDITVESELNKGSTFTVSFALKLLPEEDVDYTRFVNLPVLVVDDDIIACESACTILNDLSMHSEWVTSGREAVKKTVEHHEKDNDYYAVIVDWKMPEMNGIETTREIRKQVGDDIPIIVISAYDWTDIETEARAAGANAFLSKPLFRSKVVNLFNDLLGSAGSDDENTDQSAPAKINEKLDKELKNRDYGGKRVLLAEDNELNLEIAVELMNMMNIEVDVAVNGKICVDKFIKSKEGYYDLIFMDIQMPLMNGYEATSAIRALSHPDAKKIPIVAMSANAFSSDVRNAYDVGMNGHISKPIEVKRVVKVLDQYLGDEA